MKIVCISNHYDIYFKPIQKLPAMMNKKLFAIAFCLSYFNSYAQSNNLIEGGKTLIELISLLKKNKPISAANNNDKNVLVDSCATKQIADLCFKNSTNKVLIISIYKRNEAGYESKPFTMKVIIKNQDCWYQLKVGIYKYQIETENNKERELIREGELKLGACENMFREIKE